MLDGVLEALTGIGLSTAAGLNAYIPLLTMGLLGRHTDLINLPAGWNWLENGWTIAILGVLFGIEFVADKIPIVDHLNDAVQTVIRPTSGGLAFGAAAGAETVTVDDPGQFFGGGSWLPIAAGVVISFIVHAMKAAARPVINASTGGLGGPVASTVEDTVSVGFALAAILFPILILVFLALLIWAFRVLMRRRRRRKAEKAAARAEKAARSDAAPPDPTKPDVTWPVGANRSRTEPTRADLTAAERRARAEAPTTPVQRSDEPSTGPTEPLTPPSDPWAAQDPFHEQGHQR